MGLSSSTTAPLASSAVFTPSKRSNGILAVNPLKRAPISVIHRGTASGNGAYGKRAVGPVSKIHESHMRGWS